MKQVYKNYIFSNFKNEFADGKIFKNELVVNEGYNVEIDGSSIKTTKGFESYFAKKIANISDYELFFTKNNEILQKIIYILDYEFCDEISGTCGIRYLCFDNLNNLYEILINSLEIKKFEFNFDEFPLIKKDGKYLYFYNKSGSALIFSGFDDPQYFDNLLVVKSFLTLDDNIIFVDENHSYNIFYSEKTHLINLNSSVEYYNKIDLDIAHGKVLKIEKFKNEIYIFQEYKISVFNIYSTKNKISEKCFLNSKIINNTICAIEDYFVFLTTDGIKLFDGNDTRYIFNSLTKNINYNFDRLSACAYNGRYYLLSDYKFSEGNKSVLVSCSLKDNSVVFHSVESGILSIGVIRNSLEYSFVVITNENSDRVYVFDMIVNNQKRKYLKFNKIYFDSSELKQITSIKFFSSGNFKVKIVTDIEEKELCVSDQQKMFSVMVDGYVSQIEINSEENFEIESIFIELMIVEDRL